MIRKFKMFPFPKFVLSNAIFDALESMGFQIIKSNSSLGEIVIKAPINLDCQELEILLLSTYDESSCKMQITSSNENASCEQIIDVIFDEISSIVLLCSH